MNTLAGLMSETSYQIIQQSEAENIVIKMHAMNSSNSCLLMKTSSLNNVFLWKYYNNIVIILQYYYNL